MTPELEDLAFSIVLKLAETTEPNRSALQQELCGEDLALRAAVAQLWASHQQAQGMFLEQPAIDAMEFASKRGTVTDLEIDRPAALKSKSAFEEEVAITSLKQPVPELSVGQLFGRYRVERRLGHGGMGVIYQAFDSHLQRTVALKVPILARGHTEQLVKRFLREARAVAQLSHPNLCRVFDVGIVDGTLFLAMEFIEGQTLDQHFKPDEAVSEVEVVPIIRQVALALQEAHECGIIHRDLKPANIMLNAKGQPILMDFGVARRIDNEDQMTNHGAVLGTPAYMSPEQVRGASKDIGPVSDIYSLGVVMYRLLTGKRPFEGTFTALLSAIPTEVPTAPRQLCPDIHPAVEAICLKAMAKKPSDRFASAAEMATALDRVLCPDQSGHDKRRTWLVPGLVGIVAVGTVVLIGLWSRLGEKSDEAKNSDTTDSSVAATSVPPAIESKTAATEMPKRKRITADPILVTHLQRAQQQQGYEVLSQQSLPLHAHDKLQFQVKLNAPSYVYLYLIDTKGIPNRLWPETSEELDQQKPVTELWAPSLAGEGQKQKMYFLDDLHGHETVLVATSQRPLSHADLQNVETVRLNLAQVDGDKPKLVSFRKEDRERGIGGIVETDKALPVEIDRFTERLSRVFDGYTGIVFPHE